MVETLISVAILEYVLVDFVFLAYGVIVAVAEGRAIFLIRFL